MQNRYYNYIVLFGIFVISLSNFFIVMEDDTTTNHKVSQKLSRSRFYHNSKTNQKKALKKGRVVVDDSRKEEAVVVVDERKKYRRHDGVAVVTKSQGPKDLNRLKQMLCLFTQAYNKEVWYDIIIFTTEPWPDTFFGVTLLQELVYPATLTIVPEMTNTTMTLRDVLQTMTRQEAQTLADRCNESSVQDLSWSSECTEEGYKHKTTLSYGWQAEFRSYRLWKHSALTKYKYMLWMDSDAFPTKPWDADPVDYAIQNNLVLFFDNFPMGQTRNKLLKKKMMMAYDKAICGIELTEDGKLKPVLSTHQYGKCELFLIRLVHGFLHITNLDFYRSQSKFFQILTETTPFSRQWDDQIAVTVPAAIMAPQLAWSMREHGFNLSIYHHGDRDGRIQEPFYPKGYRSWFKGIGGRQPPGGAMWKDANDTCYEMITRGG